MQLEPEKYNRGMLASFRKVVAEEGAGALLTGFGPTAAGYFLQGALKFGGGLDRRGVGEGGVEWCGVYIGSSNSLCIGSSN